MTEDKLEEKFTLELVQNVPERFKDKLKPDDMDSRYRLAVFYLKADDMISAFEEYKELKVVSPELARKLKGNFK